MKHTRIWVIIVIICVCFGCAHTELTRRYKSIEFDEAKDKSDRYVQVSAFVIDTPESSTSTSISKLTAEGQHGFFKAVGSKAKDMKEVYEALLHTGSEDEEKKTIDKTVFKKRIIFSVEKDLPWKGKADLTPADRLNTLMVKLNLQDNENDPIFASMDKLTTKYGTVDLGKLVRTHTTKASLDMSIGAPSQLPVTVSASPSISNQQSIEETINLNSRYIEITGAIKDAGKNAVIFQEAPVGYDLTGNFTVDLIIKIPAHNHSGMVHFSNLVTDSKPTPASKVKVSFGDIYYPIFSQAVTCDINNIYFLRHVLSDDRELAEGLQHVRFIKGEPKKSTIDLVSQRELELAVYKILGPNESQLYIGEPITYEKDESEYKSEKRNVFPLRFAELASAQNFLTWIKKTKSTTIGGYTIYSGRGPLKIRDIAELVIRRSELTRDKEASNHVHQEMSRKRKEPIERRD